MRTLSVHRFELIFPSPVHVWTLVDILIYRWTFVFLLDCRNKPAIALQKGNYDSYLSGGLSNNRVTYFSVILDEKKEVLLKIYGDNKTMKKF